MGELQWSEWHTIETCMHIRLRPLAGHDHVFWVEWQASTTDPPQAMGEYEFEGFVKSGGCLEWREHDDVNHICGPLFAERLAKMLLSVYRLAHPMFASPEYKLPSDA